MGAIHRTTKLNDEMKIHLPEYARSSEGERGGVGVYSTVFSRGRDCMGASVICCVLD